MINQIRLLDELKSAGLPVMGTAVLLADADESGWTNTSSFHEKPEGKVRLDWSDAPTAQQKSQANALLAAHDGTQNEGEKLDSLSLPARVQAAIVLRLSASWATATAGQKARVQAVLDQAGARVLALLA